MQPKERRCDQLPEPGATGQGGRIICARAYQYRCLRTQRTGNGTVVLWTVLSSNGGRLRCLRWSMKMVNGQLRKGHPLQTPLPMTFILLFPLMAKFFTSGPVENRRRDIRRGLTCGSCEWRAKGKVGHSRPFRQYRFGRTRIRTLHYCRRYHLLLFFDKPASGFNICMAKKWEQGYAKPVRLPFNINGIRYEDGPFVAPDGSFAIFESDRPEAIDGSLDPYITFRKEQRQWTLPVNMAPAVNSGFAERFARLSPRWQIPFLREYPAGQFRCVPDRCRYYRFVKKKGAGGAHA